MERFEGRLLLTRLVDFDLDGDLDAVSSAAWFENVDGRGEFREHLWDVTRDAHFAVADFDRDSRPDVITDAGVWFRNETASDGTVAVNSSIQFSSPFDHVIDFEVRDFDGDRDVDLWTRSDSSLTLFENHERASRFKPTRVALDWLPSAAREGSFVVDDFDRDGVIDFVSIQPVLDTSCDTCWQIVHHANESAGGESGPTTDGRTLGEFSSHLDDARLFIADMDGDNHPDVIVERKELWYWLRNEGGEFKTAHSGSELNGQLIDIRDRNNDRIADVVFSDGDRIAWTLSGQGDATREVSGDFSTTGYSVDDLTDLGDINGDGVIDFLLAETFEGQPVWIDGASMKPSLLNGRTLPGDSNLDGVFDSTDLVTVFQTGEYEDNRPKNSKFEEGDWNGDGDFDTNDLVLVFQLGHYQLAQYPRLAFTADQLPAIRDGIEASPIMKYRYQVDVDYAISRLDVDYSDPNLFEQTKSRDASRFAFLVLMMDRGDPLRASIAEQTRQIMWHINDGLWPSTNVLPDHHAGFDGTDLHPWFTGSSLMEYSLAYDWMMGAGELDSATRAEAKFRILRVAQVEHDVHSTPIVELDMQSYYYRNANKRFRSIAGVGIVALAFPDHTGQIFDPQDRLSDDLRMPFNSQEVLSWVLHEFFEQITIAAPTNPTDQGMIPHYLSRDGVYGESFTYQLDTFEVTTPFLVFLEKTTGMDYLTEDGLFDDRVLQMYESNFKVMLPDHSRPGIGDAWFGKDYFYHELIAPYTDNPSRHYWAFEQAFNGRTHNLGLSAAGMQFKNVEGQAPNYRTEFLENAGLAVMRDKWGRDATHLMMIASDRPIRGHRQADQGSFTLYAEGTYLVLDPGYGPAYGRNPENPGYARGGPWNWLNSALGHSGITVDSLYNVDSTPAEELRSVVHPRTTIHSYTTVLDPGRIQNTLASDDIDYAEAHVTFTEKQVEMTRAIAFPRQRYFIIEDTLQADAMHDYGWQLQLGNSSTGNLSSTGNQHLWTIPNPDGELVGLSIEMLAGDRQTNIYANGPTNMTGYVYPDDVYDHTYMLASEHAQNSRYLTLLDPHRVEDEQPVQAESIVEGRAWKVVHSDGAYDLIVSQKAGRPLLVGEIATDVEFLVASIDVVQNEHRVRSVLTRGQGTVNVGYDENQVFEVLNDELLKLI